MALSTTGLVNTHTHLHGALYYRPSQHACPFTWRSLLQAKSTRMPIYIALSTTGLVNTHAHLHGALYYRPSQHACPFTILMHFPRFPHSFISYLLLGVCNPSSVRLCTLWRTFLPYDYVRYDVHFCRTIMYVMTYIFAVRLCTLWRTFLPYDYVRYDVHFCRTIMYVMTYIFAVKTIRVCGTVFFFNSRPNFDL